MELAVVMDMAIDDVGDFFLVVVVMDMAIDDVGDFFLVVLAKVPRGGLAGDHALVYLFLFFYFF